MTPDKTSYDNLDEKDEVPVLGNIERWAVNDPPTEFGREADRAVIRLADDESPRSDEVEVVRADAYRVAVEAARKELLTEITRALRTEGFVYMNYGPRAADFIDREFGGQ